jgi:hypothetical protein
MSSKMSTVVMGSAGNLAETLAISAQQQAEEKSGPEEPLLRSTHWIDESFANHEFMKQINAIEIRILSFFSWMPQISWGLSSFWWNLSSRRCRCEYFGRRSVDPIDLVGGRREHVTV